MLFQLFSLLQQLLIWSIMTALRVTMNSGNVAEERGAIIHQKGWLCLKKTLQRESLLFQELAFQARFQTTSIVRSLAKWDLHNFFVKHVLNEDFNVLPEVSLCSCNPVREKYIFSFFHLPPAEKINVVFPGSDIWNALLSPTYFASYTSFLHPPNAILLSDLLKTASS